jgi:anion-transporting  ArsA/GET3 family ATPase
VVVDAPASGHGLAMLTTPGTFGEIARVGPIRQQAEILDKFIRNRKRTGMAVEHP